MVGAREGDEAYMIPTRRVAALLQQLFFALTMSSWYMLFLLVKFVVSLVHGAYTSKKKDVISKSLKVEYSQER